MSGEASGFDIDSLIQGDIEQKKKKERDRSAEITLRQYLALVTEDPHIPQLASNRLADIFEECGVEDIPEDDQIFGAKRRYKLISEDLFGHSVDAATEAFVNWLNTGPPTEQMALVFVGPTASGKSSFVNRVVRALESNRERRVFVLKGCPMQEEPLHALPRYMRRSHFDEEKAAEVGLDQPIEDKLGIANIEGDLCPVCRGNFIGWDDPKGNRERGEYMNEDGVFEWWNILVESFTFSKQAGRGIGSFEPSDEKSQDVTDLVGHENVGITQNPKYGRKHPNAFGLSGELEKGNRGVTEAREVFKRGIDERLLWVLINVAAEKEIKVQGSNLPHIYVDTVVLGHCNLIGFKDFDMDQGQEGLHSRFYIIPFGYNLRVRDEVRVYRKLIGQRSDLHNLQKCHIAPGSLELAATFAILTRLRESDMGIDTLTKLKAYNGEAILAELDEESGPVDLRSIIEEGQSDQDVAKREGMFGIDPRDILAALNTAIAEERGANGCLTPLKTIRALRDVFEHRMGYTPEDIKTFLEFLSAEESGSVITEYKEFVVQQVGKAFLRAYDDLAREIFDRYLQEVAYDRQLKRKFTRDGRDKFERDSVTGKARDPDEKLMRSVEEHIPVSPEEASVWRGEILEVQTTVPDFGYETWEPLRKAVERKLLADARSSLTLVLTTDKPKGEEDRKRAKDLFEDLEQQGFCPICAKETVEKASEIINE